MTLHTILGSGGSIGPPLARELKNVTTNIRLVSRNPDKVNPEDECFPADITIKDQLDNAVKGSEVVYLTVGLEYNIKIWEAFWPQIMKNTIDSCQRYGSKLVFFDNVYMYDRDFLGHMTEDTPIRPTSRKGAVRAQIADMLLTASGQGKLTALIARSADFIGVRNSILTEMVVKNLSKGKKATWMADVNKIHSFTYTIDAAKGVAILGQSPDAFGQVWHLPTSDQKVTGLQWINLFAKELQTRTKIRVLPVWLMGIMGIFIPLLKELKEMAYQFDRDYYFDSTKFESRFGVTPKSPKDCVKEVLEEISLHEAK